MSDSHLDARVREALDAGEGFPRFASTSAAANEGTLPDDGLGDFAHLGDTFRLKNATDLIGAEMFGEPTCPRRS